MPARYVLAILGSIGMAIVYGLKVNLSVAMVAMVNHTAIHLLQSDHHANHILLSNVTTKDVVEQCSPPGGAPTGNVTAKSDVSQEL